jgi:hypothetical protein
MSWDSCKRGGQSGQRKGENEKEKSLYRGAAARNFAFGHRGLTHVECTLQLI